MNAWTRKLTVRFLILALCLLSVGTWGSDGVLRHDIKTRIEPEKGELTVTDRISLPRITEAKTTQDFLLHRGLRPRTRTPGVEIKRIGSARGAVPLERFRLSVPAGIDTITLEYGGSIQHEFKQLSESLGKERQLLAGTIGRTGVFLSSATGWYPWFSDDLVSFSLEVDLPQGWLAVSQGRGPETRTASGRTRVRWVETQPQDDIYLVASNFKAFQRDTPWGEAQVYLRSDASEMAQRYLDATERYLSLYSELIGPYPYAKFALVENFWETGYGMPSFTLLGSTVIRLPFIAYTSYPHEVLHNWWGNSVYPDYQSGNWSEGLTTYLADHLLKEAKGQGAQHRRDALQRYGDFVRGEKDFPLVEFRSRHSGASQSIGYDKGLMLFHMLRVRLGDPAFVQGLRQFYRQNRFRVAGFKALQNAFESASGQDLAAFFRQWTQRSGAARLAVQDVRVEQTDTGYRLTAGIVQTQQAPPFELNIPYAVYLEGTDQPLEKTLVATEHSQRLELSVPQRPLLLALDPRFDIFRRLDEAEVAATLSALFGADRGLIVLPAEAPSAMRKAYQALASQWAKGRGGLEVSWDKQLQALPQDRPVWILGWNNRFRGRFAETLPKDTALFQNGSLSINGAAFAQDEFSLALVGKRLGKQAHPMAWIGAHSAAALRGLARKLPHYGKYSYLAFRGPAPTIQEKGQWPITDSPLRVRLDEHAAISELPPRKPLTAVLDSGE